MTSRMATRGEVREPRLVRSIGGATLAPEPPGKPIAIPAQYWDQVIDGMKGVVHGPRGTARQAVAHLSYLMAGKTGTAQVVGMKQNEKYDITKVAKLRRDHALFIAFAPADDPRIAVGVLVENGGHGSSRAAPVARQVIDAYLADYLRAQQAPENAVDETAISVEGQDAPVLPAVKPQ
jgi:penicillin-binding protein 2